MAKFSNWRRHVHDEPLEELWYSLRVMRLSSTFSLGIALLIPALYSVGQSLQPSAITFQGAPEYSPDELLKASGLKVGQVYTSDELNEHAEHLMATGVFQKVGYKFGGNELVFTLTPISQLYPILLDNLPLDTGPELDSRLRERVLLFHGRVPPDGAVLDGVRSALEQMLAQEGITSTVAGTPFGAQSSQPATAIIFSIASPPVRVGLFQFEGVSNAMMPEITEQARHVAQAYSSDTTSKKLEKYFEFFYKDHGYAAVQIRAYRSGIPAISAEAILVPFRIVVQEGRIYKTSSISLSPAMSDRFPDIERDLKQRSERAPDDLHLEVTLAEVENRLKAKGYLDCSATARTEIDDDSRTSNYILDVDPGPIYHLAFMKFENTNDGVRELLMRNWQMVPGDPFDESYVAKFMLQAQKGDGVLRQLLNGLKATYEVKPDTRTHEVTLVIRLEKQ